MRRVVFIQNFRTKKAGDIWNLPSSTALELIKRGVCRLADEPEPLQKKKKGK